MPSKVIGVLFWVTFAMPLAAQQPVVLTDEVSQVPLGPYLEILEDPSTSWTLQDVTAPTLRDEFQRSQRKTPSFGFTRAAYWVRFRVDTRSRAQAWRLVLRTSTLNHVRFYRPSPEGGYDVVETGNQLPFASREIPHRLFRFELPSLAPGAARREQVQTYYLRFETEAAMILPLTLWATHELEHRDQLDTLGLGLFYGVMLALIGYNLLLFLSLRDASYFYHVLHLSLSMLALLAYDGLGQQLFWPWDRPWDPRSVIFFLAAATGAALKFTSTLLRTRELAPTAHRALTGAAWLSVGFLVLSVVLPYDVVAKSGFVFQLFAFGLILLVSWSVWRRGYRPARFFLASWLVFAFGIPVLLVLTRVVPVLPPEWLGVGLRLGTDGFVLLFSMALADRIHIIREERALAQSELLREQQGALDLKDALYAALEASKTELEARNAELERYTYTVSHDLKTPIVTIKGFLGLLERDLEQGRGERGQEHIQRVKGAADKMARLLDELLEMSRVGRVMGEPVAIELSSVAGEAAELVTGPGSERAIEIDIEPAMPTVAGDRTRILEVFQNLIENAAKFTHDQAAPRIEIRARQGDDEVTCSVRDNGIGIDPAYHETIFGLFDQLDPSGGGTGIGLALVKRIVEVHGGKIWVESAGAGQGSTFSFTLPRHVA